METKARYVLVGAFVLLFGLALLGFIVWIVGTGGEVPKRRYLVLYPGSVTGLAVGSAVRLNGVDVGEVIEVSLDYDNPEQVRLLLEIDRNVPIKINTVASLELAGLTGGRYVLLSDGTADAAPLERREGEAYPIITAKPSSIEQLLAGAPDVLENINRLLLQANVLLKDENLAKVDKILADFETVSTVLASNSDRIDALINDANQTLDSLNRSSAEIETLAASLQKETPRLLRNADSVLTEVGALAGSLRTNVDSFSRKAGAGAEAFVEVSGQIADLIRENREPVRDFTAQGLFEFVNFLTEARDLIADLRVITTNLQRDPARFLFGDQSTGYRPSSGPLR